MDTTTTVEESSKGNGHLNVTPVTEYDPFEAKFCASLYWLVFQATEDGTFDNVPSQVTSPILRDNDRITIRPEVVEFLTHGEIYSRVCNCIYRDGATAAVGHWGVIQLLSRHGVYVVEDGEIAVTDSALQQKKPFRKSTHLSLMDALMTALAMQLVDTQKVVKCIRRISSFNASKELPFDLEDSLLLWVNKICSALNAQQLKKQKLQTEQLLLNQDKAKRFRFRRDQLQPKVQITFPCLEDLLKDISDGQCLLGVILFYRPEAFDIQDICFGKDLSMQQIVKNLELFRIKCSQYVCTSALSLRVEDIMYGSQAMKPNLIALLAEMFHKCEGDEEEVTVNKTLQPKLNDVEESNFKSRRYLTDSLNDKEQNILPVSCANSSSASEYLCRNDTLKDFTPKRALSEDTLNKVEKTKSYRSPFQLDFTDDLDLQCDPRTIRSKENENAFNEIFQKPVLAGKGLTPRGVNSHCSPRIPTDEYPSLRDNESDQGSSRVVAENGLISGGVADNALTRGGVSHHSSKALNGNMSSENKIIQDKNRLLVDPLSDDVILAGDKYSSMKEGRSGSPKLSTKQNQPLLTRRIKQKQRSLVWDGVETQREEGEDNNALQKLLKEFKQHDLRRSHSLNSGLDNARVAPRHSFHAWQDTSASLSESNLNASTSNRISLQFRPNHSGHVSSTQKEDQSVSKELTASPTIARKLQPSIHLPENSRAGQININKEIRYSVDQRKSVASATDSLKEFEQIEAMLKAEKEKAAVQDPVEPQHFGEDDELNVSCTSDDMNEFRMEVLRRVSRVTEDNQEVQENTIEMEDDDDPILAARKQAAVSSQQTYVNCMQNKPSVTSLECPETAEQMELLSPITEGSEPHPSTESIPSRGSTAPSSPCSPLDIAPFNPKFLTTSPVNIEETAEEVNKRRQSAPLLSFTPRLQSSSKRENIASFHSSSIETLARGSYTVDNVSLEAAKAAGIPVIGLSRLEGNIEENSQNEIVEGSFEDALNSFREVGKNESSHFRPIQNLLLNSVESKSSCRDSKDVLPQSSQHFCDSMDRLDNIQSSDGNTPRTGDELIICDRKTNAGQIPNEDNKDKKETSQPQSFTEQVNTFVKPKRTDPLVFDFDETTLHQFHSSRLNQKGNAENKIGKFSPPKETSEEGMDDTDARQKGSTIGRFSTFRKDTKPTAAQLNQANEIPINDDLLKSAFDERFTTFRKGKQGAESQLSGTTVGGVIQEKEGESDVSKSPISSVDTQQQFSPGSVTRSKTFRKSTGLSESALVKPNHEVPNSVDVKKETSTPFSSSSSPRSMIPQLHQQKARRDSIESESPGPAKITWMETIDNWTLQQPAANKQVCSGTSPRSRSPRQEQGRSSPSARITWLTVAKSGVGGQVCLDNKGK